LASVAGDRQSQHNSTGSSFVSRAISSQENLNSFCLTSQSRREIIVDLEGFHLTRE
jgi:hypothetical protein